jgi:hypothetical protein
MLDRTLFAETTDPRPAALADYLRRCRESLATGDKVGLLAGAPAWAATEAVGSEFASS